MEVAIGHPHLDVRRNHVQMIRLDGHAFGDLNHRHRCVIGQERRECALVLRCQVLHQHDREAGIGRQRADQARERLQAAR